MNVDNVIRRDADSVPSDLITDENRLSTEDEVTPELSVNGMVLEESLVESNCNNLDLDPGNPQPDITPPIKQMVQKDLR